MLSLENASETGLLARAFGDADARLKILEERIRCGEVLPLPETVDQSIELLCSLVTACPVSDGKKLISGPGADLLELCKVLARGEPSWHAIRDNCRELVYYRNCINMERQDALPPAPEKMAVRTARHVCLDVRTRCVRDGTLNDGPVSNPNGWEYKHLEIVVPT